MEEICPDCKARLRYDDIDSIWYCARCYYEEIKTCEKCEDEGIKRTEIPRLWDCSACRNLNKDYRCMSCGEPVVVPFRYCSERCMADATDWGVWHPIVNGVVLDQKGFGSREDAMTYSDAQDAIMHGDYVTKGKRTLDTDG